MTDEIIEQIDSIFREPGDASPFVLITRRGHRLFVPDDMGNAHRKAIQEWLDNGGVIQDLPAASPEKEPPEIRTLIEAISDARDFDEMKIAVRAIIE